MSLGKVFVAGHKGMVGSSIIRELTQENLCSEIITIDKLKVNLSCQNETLNFIKFVKPDVIIIAAAKVGGIFANDQFPADFIYENLMIECNLIKAAHSVDVKSLLFLGSSCIYPKDCPQPIKEEYLLTGKLEPTNEPYAISKIAGIKMCESFNRQYKTDFRSVMPCNLYGPGDNYHGLNSHVIPALIKKIHNGKVNNSPYVEIWGTGNVQREFLHVDDLAKACCFILKISKKKFLEIVPERCSHINVGTSEEIYIKKLATEIADVIGYEGEFKYDKNKPDGVKRKVLDTNLIRSLGWKPSYSLKQGIKNTYASSKLLEEKII